MSAAARERTVALYSCAAVVIADRKHTPQKAVCQSDFV